MVKDVALVLGDDHMVGRHGGAMTTQHGSAPRGEPHDEGVCARRRKDGRPTSTLVIDLAVVQDQLRSLAERRDHTGPAPHSTALGDQLQAREREILLSLDERRLSFRPVDADGGLAFGGSGGTYVTW